jgi:hypothetical protein
MKVGGNKKSQDDTHRFLRIVHTVAEAENRR